MWQREHKTHLNFHLHHFYSSTTFSEHPLPPNKMNILLTMDFQHLKVTFFLPWLHFLPFAILYETWKLLFSKVESAKNFCKVLWLPSHCVTKHSWKVSSWFSVMNIATRQDSDDRFSKCIYWKKLFKLLLAVFTKWMNISMCRPSVRQKSPDMSDRT